MAKKVFSATTTPTLQEAKELREWTKKVPEEAFRNEFLGVPLSENKDFLNQYDDEDFLSLYDDEEPKTRGEILKRDNTPWALEDE